MPDSVGFGVLGGRSFIGTAAVMPAIDAAERAVLTAVAARSGPVDERWSNKEVADYDDVIAHPEVDVVYIALPNGQHRQWTERAAAAGKHVLCEKPLAANADEAAAMAAVCRAAGVELFEAWMTPFGPRWATAMKLARSGELGTITSVETAFTFTIAAGNETNYRWDPTEGGGALLDVGIYALGPAVALFGPDPVTITARADHRGGVDVTTEATLTWPDDRMASFVVSFERDEAQRLRITGERGSIEIADEAHTGNPEATDVIVVIDGVLEHRTVAGRDPYLGMVDAVVEALRGDRPWSRTPEKAIDLLRLLDRIAVACSG